MAISINLAKGKESLCYRFSIEFIAYNFSLNEEVKKIYLKRESEIVDNSKSYFNFTDNQIQSLALALNNGYISAFNSDRYSLYDISFRETKLHKAVGFSFIDTHDYEYVDPEKIFECFSEFGIDGFLKDISLIENGLFLEKPNYNPIFMCGTVFEGSLLKSLRAYIRYDLAELPNVKDRLGKLNNIANLLNAKTITTSEVYKIAESLESKGFVFAFIGVDCYKNKKKRYKIYFRNYEKKNNGLINEKILQFVKKQSRTDASEVFKDYNSGLWGVAIATESFEYANGIQIYFYP